MRIIRGEGQISAEPLRSRTVAVLGFGNQGRAHALNLRDSGVNIVVGTRRDSRAAGEARALGFDVLGLSDASSRADLVIMALPDEVQGSVYRRDVEPALRRGCILGFLHGFAVRFGQVDPRPDLGVILVAPKGPGTALRDRYLRGMGLPCLFAVHRDSPDGTAEGIGLAWARAIGCARAAIIVTTFAAETETDLFGEQAVLCGGMSALITAAFDTLVDAGYDPELAYLECCHEVKQIADLVHERGLAGMRESISNTAEFGEYHAGPRVVDEHVRQRLRDLLEDIRSGRFARLLQQEHDSGFRSFLERRKEASRHPIEDAGRTVRSLMPWLAEQGSASVSGVVESTGSDRR